MTKSLSVNSDEIKLGLMMLYRFKYQAIMVLTEAGRFSADVLVVNKRKEAVECEVKVTLADFKHDFIKEKHIKYNQSLDEMNESKIESVPHYFYFVVPETIASAVASKLAAYPNYGMITYRDIPFEANVYWIAASKFFKFVKEPKRLRSMPITDKELFKMKKRLSSELIREKIKTLKG